MISYRFMTRGEERQVFGLVESVFNEYVRNDFSLEGIEEFFRAARHMIFDWPSDHFIIVAAVRDKITGMIAMKENRRISLFFVDSSYRRRGIGRTLLHHALAHCAGHASGVNEFEVHSSLYAVPIYEKLGFKQTKAEQIINGIRFVEMIKPPVLRSEREPQ